MKRFLTKSIAIMVAFVIILAIATIPASATSETCVEDHFSKLKSYWDENLLVRATPPSVESCGYVALSMLLSFYDSYWNDVFVADRYEWNKGIYNSQTGELIRTFAAIDEAEDWITYVADLELNANEVPYPYYPFYAQMNSDLYFESYLASIGINDLKFHREDDTLPLSGNELRYFIEYYLISECSFNNARYILRYEEQDEDDAVEIIKEKVEQGTPVIYYAGRRVNENEQEGHFMIAYGVDEHGNIMLHTGWQIKEHRILLTEPGTEDYYKNEGETGDQPTLTDYTLFRGIYWLDVTGIPHTHSYNYINSVTNEPLCSCQIYSSHPEHESNHKYFVKTNSEKRWEECACGDTINMHTHEKNYTIDSLELHSEECSICDYEAQVEHTFYLKSFNSIYHIEECECGMVGEITEHAESNYSKQNNTSHSILCNCGYVMGTASHSLVPFGNQRYRCTDCGALFNASSDIIIKKDDPEYEVE